MIFPTTLLTTPFHFYMLIAVYLKLFSAAGVLHSLTLTHTVIYVFICTYDMYACHTLRTLAAVSGFSKTNSIRWRRWKTCGQIAFRVNIYSYTPQPGQAIKCSRAVKRAKEETAVANVVAKNSHSTTSAVSDLLHFLIFVKVVQDNCKQFYW